MDSKDIKECVCCMLREELKVQVETGYPDVNSCPVVYVRVLLGDEVISTDQAVILK